MSVSKEVKLGGLVIQEQEITKWEVFTPIREIFHSYNGCIENVPTGHKEITITCKFENRTQTDVMDKIFSANCNASAREANLYFGYDDIPPALVFVQDVYIDEEDYTKIYLIVCAPIGTPNMPPQ